MSFGVLHDGRPCADAAAASRALQYGDGVFRTLLWFGDGPVDWDLHVDKLAADCAALGLQMPVPAALAAEARQVVGDAQQAVIKIIVARSAIERGYRSSSTDAERWVMAFAAPPVVPEAYAGGIEVALSPVAVSEQPLLAGVKHLNRLDQVLASRTWPDGVAELLMCDAAGRLIGGTRSNLFCVAGAALLTPRLDRCGVAGIMRRKILERCRSMGIRAESTDLSLSDIERADEVFISNALIGIWPVRALAGRRWAAPGAVTQSLMYALKHPRVVMGSTRIDA